MQDKFALFQHSPDPIDTAKGIFGVQHELHTLRNVFTSINCSS